MWLLFLLALLEVSSCVGSGVLQDKWAMYQDPQPVEGHDLDYEEYLRIRDPQLGWPRAVELGGPRYAEDGSRVSPANVELRDKSWRVSLYGDSFTHADEVDDEAAWGNQLARILQARVKSFGVSGYGSDQAYLRFRLNEADQAEAVVLSHMSENVIRNLTRYRDFTTFARHFAFKPRFVIGADGKLELVPMPDLSRTEYQRFLDLESPQLTLEHESFHPNGPSGAVRPSFPYTWAVIKNFGFYRLRARLSGRPVYEEFYEPGHELRGLETTREICRAFHAEALARGKKPLIVIFPAMEDLELHREHGRWVYQSLIDELGKLGIEVLNFGETLEEHLDGRDPAAAYGRQHFTKEINRLVAETIRARLER